MFLSSGCHDLQNEGRQCPEPGSSSFNDCSLLQALLTQRLLFRGATSGCCSADLTIYCNMRFSPSCKVRFSPSTSLATHLPRLPLIPLKQLAKLSWPPATPPHSTPPRSDPGPHVDRSGSCHICSPIARSSPRHALSPGPSPRCPSALKTLQLLPWNKRR